MTYGFVVTVFSVVMGKLIRSGSLLGLARCFVSLGLSLVMDGHGKLVSNGR